MIAAQVTHVNDMPTAAVSFADDLVNGVESSHMRNSPAPAGIDLTPARPHPKIGAGERKCAFLANARPVGTDVHHGCDAAR
tara:strand:- start:902 stop:1144 length:243 start_codon:yes stop_codon:yes gene_type:complete